MFTYCVGILSKYIWVRLVSWKLIPYWDWRVDASPGYALKYRMVGIILPLISFSVTRSYNVERDIGHTQEIKGRKWVNNT